jgi:glycosyltransferase involved in cell wall biosynthesis
MDSSSTPLVSFVVPCYNYGRFLPDCLNSIFGQDGNYAIEVIAIDDASSDNTLDVLAQFPDDRMRIIRHEKNEGHVRTISQGLRESRGQFVARIDPDDRYRSCFLAETIPAFQRDPEVGFVYGDAALINSEGRLDRERTDAVHHGKDFSGNEFIPLMVKNFVCAPTVIARREAWLETLPVPADLAFSDWYFNLMIARRHKFSFVSRVLADYRVHAANHHAKVIANKTEEPSIFFLLDRIFGETERTPELQQQKLAARGRVYAAQYLDMATKYFGGGMRADARRCYGQAIRHSPSHLLSFVVLRRLAATYLDPEKYNGFKRALGRRTL